MKYVYEIVDASCEEMYWPGGIWPTFESALSVLRGREKPPYISGGFYDGDDGLDRACEFQIRRHKLGEWSEHGLNVTSVIWTRVWDEEADDDVWLEVKVISTKHTLPEEMGVIDGSTHQESRGGECCVREFSTLDDVCPVCWAGLDLCDCCPVCDGLRVCHETGQTCKMCDGLGMLVDNAEAHRESGAVDGCNHSDVKTIQPGSSK